MHMYAREHNKISYEIGNPMYCVHSHGVVYSILVNSGYIATVICTTI